MHIKPEWIVYILLCNVSKKFLTFFKSKNYEILNRPNLEFKNYYQYVFGMPTQSAFPLSSLFNKLNKKLIKNVKNRELLYAEAQEKAISEQRKALKVNLLTTFWAGNLVSHLYFKEQAEENEEESKAFRRCEVYV